MTANKVIAPTAIDSEKTLIGAALLRPDVILPACLPLVLPSEFHHAVHRALWETLGAMSASSEPIDAVTVASSLDDPKVLNCVGGSAYLDELAGGCVGIETENAIWHARLIAQKAERARYGRIAAEVATHAYDGENDDAEFFAAAESKLMQLSQQRRGVDIPDIRTAMRELIREVAENYQRHRAGRPSAAVMTGLRGLDGVTLGLLPSWLVIAAGRPGSGKTALALNCIDHATENETACLVFSLEMSRKSLLSRLLRARGVDGDQMRTGNMSTANWSRLNAVAADHVERGRLWIDDAKDCGDMTISAVRSRARRWMQDKRVQSAPRRLVVVDYLQLVKADEKHGNREGQVAEVSRGLKAMAKELDVPVLALAQLNRESEKTPNKRPGMSHLRESGQIEQDADVIAFIHRPEMYETDEKKKAELAGVAMLDIAKNRDGETATVPLVWLPDQVRFVDRAPEHYNPPHFTDR